jgi:DNA-binding XRE family transcriptional regulator
MNFSNWLKTQRNYKKLTQKQLAKILGVSRQTINYWESGKSSISSLKQVQNLCKVLDCNIQDVPID